MKQAIIDIGSNSMRLTVYEVAGETFKILFREKSMAGLAGYVEEGRLSPEGIARACSGLLEFRETLAALDITAVAVFATASLRNIFNTAEAVWAIQTATDFSVEVLSGTEEALLGYYGAGLEVHCTSGAFLDIGGGSTEVVVFDQGQPVQSASFRMGSLSLYRSYVKKILPGDGALKRMKEAIEETVEEKALLDFSRRTHLICVGGTARAALKLCKKVYHLTPGSRTITMEQLEGLCQTLETGDQNAIDLLLRHVPERIHTMVPGLLILHHLGRLFETKELVVCKYGVREGYLCQKVLQIEQNNTDTPKTGS